MIPEFVIQHFSLKKGLTYEQSFQRHVELDAFLRKASKTMGLVPTVSEDEAWHNFILHTKLYAQYCNDNYGFFIHHNPKIPNRLSFGANCTSTEDEEVNCDCGRKGTVLAYSSCNGNGDNDGSCSHCDTSFK